MLQELLPVQLTRTLIVVPDVLMCLTVARAGGVAVIGLDWPLLGEWVLSPAYLAVRV
jgi:hypothetical protein